MRVMHSMHQENAFEEHHPEAPLDAAAGMKKVPMILSEDRQHKAKVQAVFVDTTKANMVTQKLK